MFSLDGVESSGYGAVYAGAVFCIRFALTPAASIFTNSAELHRRQSVFSRITPFLSVHRHEQNRQHKGAEALRQGINRLYRGNSIQESPGSLSDTPSAKPVWFCAGMAGPRTPLPFPSIRSLWSIAFADAVSSKKAFRSLAQITPLLNRRLTCFQDHVLPISHQFSAPDDSII